MAFDYKRFCVSCSNCGGLTSKKYARAHNGQCKNCAEPKLDAQGNVDISNHPLLCPDCHEHLLTPYQKAHHYHCDHCTRACDPQGYINELRGLNDGPDY